MHTHGLQDTVKWDLLNGNAYTRFARYSQVGPA